MSFDYSLGPFSEDEDLLEKYRNSFSENNYVIIPDFLNDESAEKLHKWLTTDMPKDWWHWSLRTKSFGPDEHVTGRWWTPMGATQMRELSQHHKVVEDALNRKVYAFSFSRTNPHSSGCPCLECDFRKFVTTPAMMKPIEFITNSSWRIEKQFSSLYKGGDFLMPHDDHPHGTLSGAIQFTKSWFPAWGGQYQLLDSQWKPLISNVPEYNTMFLFNSSLQHQVTYVPEAVQAERVGMTLWWHSDEQPSKV